MKIQLNFYSSKTTINKFKNSSPTNIILIDFINIFKSWIKLEGNYVYYGCKINFISNGKVMPKILPKGWTLFAIFFLP